MTSVLQPWVMELPLREQGTLLTAIRGCDVAPKLPLDSTARQLTAYLRWLVMVAFDPREVDAEPGAFMQSHPPADWKPSELGHYPLHWYTHLMHAYEVVAFRLPASDRRCQAAWDIYLRMVRSLHLQPEGSGAMKARLSEDRIAKGEIVS